MTDAGASLSAPTADRIRSLDVARGVSLLGILLMNILAFAMHFAAYGDPTVAGGSSVWDLRLFAANFVLFEGKMRAIFSLLFGAGIILFTRREELHGTGSASDLYFRRNLWLVVFGVIHAMLLLWPGDILFTYGVTALFLYVFRNARPRMLLSFAAACIAVNLAFSGMRYADIQSKEKAFIAADSARTAGLPLTPKQVNEIAAWQHVLEESKPDAEALAAWNTKMRGSYGTVAGALVPFSMMVQSTYFYFSFFWDAAAMMLIGMALYRFGMLTLEWSTRRYLLTAAVCYGIGIPLGLWALGERQASNFALDQSMLAEIFTYEARRLLMVLGHLAMIMLAARASRMRFITDPLAAVGRMAFSNYIMQTVICTLFFYGYGLAKYGTMSRTELYGVVAAVWIIQLVVSPIWLRYFRFGPLEWAWRSLTYWQRQPMRYTTHSSAPDELLSKAA